MDQPLPDSYKKKILLKRIISFLLIIIVPLSVLLIFRGVLNKEISLSNIVTASPEKGDIQITVQGSGIVIPVYEEVIISPFRSNLRRIVRNPGIKVQHGDTLLILDNRLAENDLDLLRNELELQKIRVEKLKIELKKLEEDFGFSSRMRAIRIENYRLAYEAESTLNRMGGSPAFNVKKAQTEWEISQLESDQSKFNFMNEVNARNNGIKELETEISILNNKIVRAKDLAGQAYVKAPFNGDLSWIIDQPGATVSEGQEIARVADFSSYKLKGTISNAWSGRIINGQQVLIRDQGKNLEGIIENIMPAISQGMMECLIRIGSGDFSGLRPDQQLEIRVVISNRKNILRLPNGPYYKGRGYKDMFVIRGRKAYRTRVLLGDANFDNVEVIEGLKEGDIVILSEIDEKYTGDELKVRK